LEILGLSTLNKEEHTMADPVTIAALDGLVTLMGKWLHYDIEKRKLEQEGKSRQQPDAEARKGEQVAQVVETGIQQHGDEREQTALRGFQQDPQMFASVLEQAMKNLAEREPAFAQQLQRVAEQTNVAQRGGTHGSSVVHGDNPGISVGVSTGTITQGGPAPKKKDE
jgi:hypothetical protein